MVNGIYEKADYILIQMAYVDHEFHILSKSEIRYPNRVKVSYLTSENPV